jgi:hypothetical protein
LARELANKDRYRPSHGVPKPRLVPRGEGMVCSDLGPFAPLVRVCFGDKWQPYACD